MAAVDQYEFADLTDHQSLITLIKALESRMKEELGEEITLIAYTPKKR